MGKITMCHCILVHPQVNTTCDRNWRLFYRVFRSCISIASSCSKCRIAELLLRPGLADMWFINAWTSNESTKCIWALPLTEVQQYGALHGNAIETCDGITFDFCTGLQLPHILHPIITPQVAIIYMDNKIIRPTRSYFSHPKLQVWGLHKQHIMKLPCQRTSGISVVTLSDHPWPDWPESSC